MPICRARNSLTWLRQIAVLAVEPDNANPTLDMRGTWVCARLGSAREQSLLEPCARSRVEENKPAHLLLLYDEGLVAQHP